MSVNTVLVAGFAEFPKGTTLYEVYKIISCVMIINNDDETIQDISFSFVMDKTNEFISQQLRGISIKNGIDEAKEKIRASMLIPGQGALIYAMQQAYDRYCEMN
ncbi:DUF3870 domain-containing protein [Brevibacillus sp. SYP-B805]|uniref:DUF3870 domain-containing protein n=1 Tax=Brevibacillus sp. SYP-B805 TaxID=1578199 RepID=UPI0013ED0404|nr:DUF3870 domain-containing protein [Brevibacillus sp. SYP-B805]